jgi:hypothetical protein
MNIKNNAEIISIKTSMELSGQYIPCNTEPMTGNHVLTRCPKLATLREEIN